MSSYDLTRLDPDTFEHMVNALALAVLGPGATGFGPGADGGRDGYFEGEAPYPSTTNRWKGVWYIQSKFHKPHLSDKPQQWLVEQVKAELAEFTKPDTKRVWPTNWIVATNIDLSGTPRKGAFDRVKKLVKEARPELAKRFAIWGGAKIIGFLDANPHIARRYGHFLTPGNVLAEMMDSLKDDRASVEAILQHLVVRKFKDQKLTKLEQAGSKEDARPAIHDLFVDVPFRDSERGVEDTVMRCLTRAGNEAHPPLSGKQEGAAWRVWAKQPQRVRVWFLRGGPGQGKSTTGQYYCQIQRAALLLMDDANRTGLLHAPPNEYETAVDVRKAASKDDFWPAFPRIPLHVELKDYAHWYGKRKGTEEPKGILAFVAAKLYQGIQQKVEVGTLRRALKDRRWVAVFDGLDEVPEDVKDEVAVEVRAFIAQDALELKCDLFSLCTSRPQGYSGQFRELDGATVDLLPLPLDRALACARPLIAFQRSAEESEKALATLQSAAKESPAVRELLTTPLQAHILAVLVRDGERPPDRRWKLYHRFYEVIRNREANRNLPDASLARLLREDEKLLKAMHNRAGFFLHAAAETSQGAKTSLDRATFHRLATDTVKKMFENMVERDIGQKVDTLARAATQRLVLISTPENGAEHRFDVRQLQEFFAAEFLYDSVRAEELRERIETIVGDAHWREVMHFLLSALVEQGRRADLDIACGCLRRLDDRDELGTLHRRAGKGALLAARLLSEGVLEQDKSMRQCFRDCLVPMMAFARVERLTEFLEVKRENSLAWLLNFLIDQLRDATLAENIGAAITLVRLLPDSHPRLPEVREFFSRVSANYLRAVIDSFFPLEIEPNPPKVPDWFLESLFGWLLRSDWIELRDTAISSVIVLQSLSTRTFPLQNDRCPTRFHSLLRVLLLSDPRSNHRSTVGVGGSDLLKSAIREVSAEALEEEGPGILYFIQLLIRFSQSPTRSVYVAILRTLHQAGDNLFLRLRRVLPLPMPRVPTGSTLAAVADEIAQGSDAAFVEMFASRIASFDPRFRHPGSVFEQSLITAQELVDRYPDYPEIVIDIFARHFKNNNLFKSSEAGLQFVEQVLPRLYDDPATALRIPWCWVSLMESVPEHATELRALIFQACSRFRPYVRWKWLPSLLWINGIDLVQVAECFLLQHHLEPSFLPVFADLTLMQPRLSRQNAIHVSDEYRSLTALWHGLKGAHNSLVAITADACLCWSVRCAAALLDLFHFDMEVNADALAPVADDLVAHCNSDEGIWLLEGLVTVLTTVCKKQTPFLARLVRDLFESCREDYVARAELEKILIVWHEESEAPVTTRSLRDRWLDRED